MPGEEAPEEMKCRCAGCFQISALGLRVIVEFHRGEEDRIETILAVVGGAGRKIQRQCPLHLCIFTLLRLSATVVVASSRVIALIPCQAGHSGGISAFRAHHSL